MDLKQEKLMQLNNQSRRDREPGGLPSMGSYRVRQEWSDLAAAAAAHMYTYVYGKNGMVIIFVLFWTSLVAQVVKNLPATQEAQVLSLGWEDPLEEGTAINSLQYSFLENPHGQRSLESYSSWGLKVGSSPGFFNFDHLFLVPYC